MTADREILLADLKGNIDFGIITVREDEFRAVLHRFRRTGAVIGARPYEICRLRTKHHALRTCAIVRCIGQGQGIAQDVARDLIEDLDPVWLLLVGICGAVPSMDFTLGDVVCATRVVDFCVRAVLQEGSTESNVGGGPMARAAENVLARLPAMGDQLKGWNSSRSIGRPKPRCKASRLSRRLYGSREWQEAVRASLQHHFPRTGRVRPPAFTTRPVATSDVLVKSTQLLKQWQRASRSIGIVEMELGGVYYAARRASREYPILAIRGISDIVGLRREDVWTRYACESAAAFTYHLLRTDLVPVTRLPSVEPAPDGAPKTSPDLSLRRYRKKAEGVATFKLTVGEEKHALCPCTLRIADAGVLLWREVDADAFWLRLFIESRGGPMPRLRIIGEPSLQARDFSHTFFAKDNLLWTDQRSITNGFASSGRVTYNVFRPKPGEETKRHCFAHAVPLHAIPTRAHIERASDHVTYVEPRDFLRYTPVSAPRVRRPRLYGVWLYCRLAERVLTFPGVLRYVVSSSVPIDYFRLQVVLSPDVEPVFTRCRCSNNMFMPWVNSNPGVGLPGAASLERSPVAGEKLIPVFYTIKAPFLRGDGTLVCESRRRPISRLEVSAGGLTFRLGEGPSMSVDLGREAHMLAILLIIQYKDRGPKLLTRRECAALMRWLAGRLGHKSYRLAKPVGEVIEELGKSIIGALGEEMGSPYVEDVVYSDRGSGVTFALLRDRLSSPDAIHFAPKVPYEKVREHLLQRGRA